MNEEIDGKEDREEEGRKIDWEGKRKRRLGEKEEKGRGEEENRTEEGEGYWEGERKGRGTEEKKSIV